MADHSLKAWLSLTEENHSALFQAVAAQKGLPAVAVEKDWWVVKTLQFVFETEIGPHTVFKGGTSLSKAWNLIDRFSEDIDLALDRKFLGFMRSDGEMTGSQVSKLRKKSFQYITETYLPILRRCFQDAGLEGVSLQLSPIRSADEDPVKIEVQYASVTEKLDYLQPRVLIEIGCRSLREPFTVRSFSTMIGEFYKGRPFADAPIDIPTVNPERTFLEKLFLLHEEFQQPLEKARPERKSRHLYDLEKLMDTQFGFLALEDRVLYDHIVKHREKLTPVRGIDYTYHAPATLNPVPPPDVLADWRKDYAIMRESMIYGESLPFEVLLERISELCSRVIRLEDS